MIQNMADKRIGKIKKANNGTMMIVLDYKNANDVTVQFLDKYYSIVKTTWKYFESGNVRNPYGANLCGVGIIGEENIRDEDGKLSIEYTTWSRMLQRCYNNSLRDRDSTYLECKVCDEWFLFSNFKNWMRSQENYAEWIKLKNKGIDKDIIYKGNKLYSPETCCLVPAYVNNLFTKHNSKRGKYCIGVSYHKRDHVFTATCHNPFTNKSEHLGCFDTEEDAFFAYKIAKEELIKLIANKEYKNGTITKKCYEAMLVYQVEKTD